MTCLFRMTVRISD